MNGSTGRRKIVALVLSGIFPGLGQFYNRQPLKGTAFAVAGAVLFWLIGRALPSDLVVQNLLLEQKLPPVESLLSMALILPLCLLLILLIIGGWSLIDAWRAAGR